MSKHFHDTKVKEDQADFLTTSSSENHQTSAATLVIQGSDVEKSSVKGSVVVVDDDEYAHTPKGFAFALLVLGLVLAVFLAALDQTIVAVALNAISQEFNSLSQITWIGTAYFLTATAFIPSYGQLADIFGRKPVFLVAIVLFEVGSALCGAATNMNMMIAARAVAGLGGGGIFSLVIIIISDLVPVRERGQYNGILGATFGLASVAGPLMGGAFVDHVSWRWVFYINLPLGVITLVSVIFILNLPTKNTSNDILGSLKKIDWLGTFLLVGAVVCILIAVQGAGTQFSWDSATAITLLVVGGLLTAAFIMVEAKFAEQPVIPFSLFKNPQVVGAFASSFFMGCSFFTLVFYCPLWFQVVANSSATSAGIHTIPMIMGVVILSIASGIVATSTGHVYAFIPIGAAVSAVGAGLVSTLNENSPMWAQIIYLFIAGAGIGCVVQTNILVGQFSVPIELLAVVTANINFWQTIGAVIGLAICSSTFNNKLPGYIQSNLDGAGLTQLNFTQPYYTKDMLYASPTFIREILYENEQGPVIHAYVQALSLLFLLAVPFSALCLISSLFMKKSKLPMTAEGLPMAG